jgi:hypothetical protein
LGRSVAQEEEEKEEEEEEEEEELAFVVGARGLGSRALKGGL